MSAISVCTQTMYMELCKTCQIKFAKYNTKTVQRCTPVGSMKKADLGFMNSKEEN